MKGATGRPLLLINLEGADWNTLNRLADAGQLNRISALIDTGSMGTLLSPPPTVPALLWNSLVTGVPATRHNIASAMNPSGQPVLDGDRFSPAVWEIAGSENLDCCVVGGWATHAASNASASIVSEFFGSSQLLRSEDLIRSAIQPTSLRSELADCWLAPDEIDLSTLSWFVPQWQDVDQDADPRLAMLAESLACNLSRHACYTWLLENEPPDLGVINYSLFDQLGRVFTPILQDQQAQDVGEEKDAGTDCYGLVTERAYQLVDNLVGRIVDIVGADALIILSSAYGYRQPANIQEARQWQKIPQHAKYLNAGFLICSGTEFKQDELVYGASIYDLVPTVLHMLGLPVAEDMPGRLLAECLLEVQHVRKIPSWKQVRVPVNSRDIASNVVPGRNELSDYFKSLGLAEPVDRSEAVMDAASTLWNWNMARAQIQDSQFTLALPVLEELAERFPERIDIALELIDCQLKLGLILEARDRVTEILDYFPASPAAYVAMARIELAAGRYEASLDVLRQAEEIGATGPLLHSYVGLSNLRLSRWNVALSSYDKVLEKLPKNADGHRGRARALLGLQRFKDASEAALDSIALNYHSPMAHYLLAISLLRRNMQAEAVVALENAARLAPNWVVPHLHLIRYKRSKGGHAEEIEAHSKLIDMAKGSRLDSKDLQAEALERQQERMRQRALAREQSVENILALDDDEILTTADALNLILVSGLPRSGCAAILAALESGGLRLLRDSEERFDWSKIQQLPKRPHVLNEAKGKIVYVPSSLLAFLPRLHHYRVIFINRPIGEVVLSSEKNSAAENFGKLDRAERARLLARHRSGVLSALRNSMNVNVLVVEYQRLLEMPEVEIERIRDFLGEEVVNRPQEMVNAIDLSMCNHHMSDDKMPMELKAGYLRV